MVAALEAQASEVGGPAVGKVSWARSTPQRLPVVPEAVVVVPWIWATIRD